MSAPITLLLIAATCVVSLIALRTPLRPHLAGRLPQEGEPAT